MYVKGAGSGALRRVRRGKSVGPVNDSKNMIRKLAAKANHILLTFAVALLAVLSLSASSQATGIKTITLNNLTAQKNARTVCVVGAGSGYTLSAPVGGVSAWTRVGATPVYPAFPLSSLRSVNLAPAGAKAFAAARLYFFVGDSGGKLTCGSIQFNPAQAVAWPQGFAEYTLAANGDLVVNISNVDSFQILLEAVFGPNSLLSFGNPVNNQLYVTARNAVGAFPVWLRVQGAPATQFGVLARTATYPGTSTGYNSLLSPTAYFQQKDAKSAFINYKSPLSAYYDQHIGSFFSGAVKGAAHLKVMGDAQGPLKQQPWTVTSNTAACPLFLVPNSPGASLRFDYDGTGKRYFILCNPYNQVVDLAGAISVTTQSGHTALVKLPADQCSKVKKGWNIAQVETSWVGQVLSTCDASSKVKVQIMRQSKTKNFSQVVCDSADAVPPCGNASTEPSYHWIASNIPWSSRTSPWEKPSQMVFGNDGIFSSWAEYLPANVADPDATRIVAASVVRNIASAFSRGIENCNNVTKPFTGSSSPPSNCAKVKVLPAGSYVSGADTASDAYWVNEANWYPAGGYQNYYSQFLHTACLTPTCSVNARIFELPNGRLPTVALSNQGAKMALAYGYPYDENPVYLSASAPLAASAYVPSKLDPIPASWNATTLTINVGPY